MRTVNVAHVELGRRYRVLAVPTLQGGVTRGINSVAYNDLFLNTKAFMELHTPSVSGINSIHLQMP